MTREAAILAPGTRLGAYDIERWLGGGGMGAVYAARHAVTGEAVAVKVLHEALSRDVDLRRRFFREARAASRLDHANAVRVLSVSSEHETKPHFAMERLYGEDLRSLLDRDRALSPRVVCSILFPVSQAIAHAHARGVIHRDLKPENIFLAVQHDGRVVPKVLDFGISKLLDEVSGTCDSSLLGTPSYMAPEQLEGAVRSSRASDQYSLAVILYEALVGEAPFVHATMYGLLTAIALGQFVRPSERRELDPRLEATVLRGMAKDPDARFCSVSEFALELAVCAGMPCAASGQRLSRADRACAPTLLGSAFQGWRAGALLEPLPEPHVEHASA